MNIASLRLFINRIEKLNIYYTRAYKSKTIIT